MERFWNKVLMPTVEGSCWLWTGCHQSAGYGQFRLAGKVKLAHRVSYELKAGPVPVGLELDHLCRVHNCVNPDHLEPVTRSENNRRGLVGKLARERNLAKTHCPGGHEYNGDNLYTHGARRACNECRRAAVARYRNKTKESAMFKEVQ